MKMSISHLLAVAASLGTLALAGCGGGGSSAGPGSPLPTPTPIAVTNANVTVQLRDSAGAIVDGIVTVDGQQRATTGGVANFANVKIGALTATAEVNGKSYNQNFTATIGTTTVQIAIDPTTGTTPGGGPPAPPTFG